MTSPTPNELAPPPVASTVHIYRGLMDRSYTWRTRIDNPTNWAVVTSGTSTSFVLGDQAISHAVLVLMMFFTCGFLIIEARRYRYYDLWGTWVRLLETDFFALALLQNHVTLGEAWQRLLVRDMHYPHYKTSLISAVGRRLRDNYLVMFMFLLFTWLLKLVIHPIPNSDTSSLQGFFSQAAIGPLPGIVVTIIVISCYAVLFIVAAATSGEREPSVEVLSRSRIFQKIASPNQQPVSRRRWGGTEHVAVEMLRANIPTDATQGNIDLED